MLQGAATLTSCSSRITDLSGGTFVGLEFPPARATNGSAQNAASAETFTKFHRTICHTMAGPSSIPLATRDGTADLMEG
jgi:hypothetical protein